MSGEGLQKTEFPVFNGYAPLKGGPKAIPLTLNFTVLGDQEFDLVAEVSRDVITFVQSIWVDNADNLNPLVLIFSQTGQRLKIPAGAQGLWPVISPQGLRCRASTTPTAKLLIDIILLNMPMPMTQYGPISVSGSLTVPTGAFTNNSVAITGADQVLIAANGARKGIVIEAPSANGNSVFVALDGNAATADFNCVEIMPGGYLPPMFGQTLSAIHVIGTAGDNITAYELA